MSDLDTRLASLSPEKLELLRARLRAEPKSEEAPPRPVEVPPPTIEPRPDERFEPFPLTEIQETYWAGRSGLFDLGSGGANSYMEYQFRGVGNLFLDRLEWAFQSFVERHDMMRTILLPDGRQQVLREVPPFRIQRVDLTGRPPEEVEEEIRRVRDRMCWESFAIDRWPLFEVVAQLQDNFRLRLHLRFDALLKDGRSRALILEEIPQLFTNPEDAALPPVGVTYRDFAVTRVEFQEHELFTRSRDYWLERIPALPPAPEIPLAVDLGPKTPSHFRLRSVDLLPAEEWQRLKSRGTRQGLTPSSVVLAAYVEAVAAWSDSPRFTLGMIGSERPPVHADIEGVFGNFNTLYLLGVDDRSGSFVERARRLQSQVSTDLEHRHFSGLQVIREINRRSRGTSRAVAPFCFNSVVRNYRGEPGTGEETWAFPEATIAAITANTANTAASADNEESDASQETPETAGDTAPAAAAPPAPPADWMVEIEGSVDVPQILLLPTFLEAESGALVCKWQAVRDAFPDGLLDGLLAGLTRLLERLATEDEPWRDTAPHLVTAGTAGLAAVQPAAPATTADGTLGRRLAAWAAAHPAETAVVTRDLTLTWSELLARADRLAAQLQHLGAGPGQPVALAVERGIDEAVGALAILRASAAVLPLPPGADAGNLARLLEHSGALIAITSGREDGQGWPQRVARVTVDAPPAGSLTAASASADDPAWIVYDATATRAAVLEHRALLATLRAAGERFGLSPADRLLTLSPAGGDAALFDLFTAWLAGAAVVYPPAGEATPARQAEQARAHGATVWSSTPALFSRLIAHIEARPEAAPRSLRLALIRDRGERGTIALSLPARAAARIPGIEVAALAGFAEASSVSAAPALSAPPAGQVSSFAWDRPLSGHSLHVLDAGLAPRPDWVAGDLYVGGEGLARGYWHDDEATRAAFVTHPRTGERLFRTGILARRLPDGAVEPLGRPEEHRIEAAGRRLQPRRIEAHLERQPGVRAAVVLPRQDGDGRTRLAAIVETPTAIQSFVVELRAALERDLPPHLVPAALEVRQELPLTPAGTVDRAALAAALVPEPEPMPAPPRSQVERDLAALWRDVLGTAPESLHDNFFDAGGTSILAARLMARVVQRFQLDEPLPAFLDRATVGHLAALVQKARDERRERELRQATGLRRLLAWLPRRRRDQTALEPLPPGGMRTFIILWIGQFISGMGTGLGSFSLGVWTFDQGQSAAQYTMVGFCAMVTGMLMMPVAGSFADRYDRRKLILFGDGAAACMTLIMATALYTGYLRVWHVYPIAILMTAFSALQGPALFASISTLVPRRHLIRAGTMSQLIGTAVGMTTPFLAGVLVAKIGYHGVILLDFVTFFAAAGTLLYIRFPAVPRSTENTPGRPSILGDVRFGWSYLRARPGLLSLLLLFAVTNFSAGIVQALLTPLIRSFATITELGTVQSAAAVGALLGSLALSVWGGPPQGRRVWAIFFCMLVQGGLLLLGGVEPSVPLVACALFLATLTAPLVGSSSAAIWQTKIAHEVQGRIFGLRGLVSSSTVPLAFLLSGFLADQVFEPLLVEGGPLAGSVGAIIGVGKGRGIGLLYILLGLFMIAWILIAFLNPRLRNVETELPDMPRPGAGGATPPPQQARPAAAGGD